MRKLALVMLCALAAAAMMQAQMANMPGMDHHDHHDDEVLGHVDFPTSCEARSQAGMQRGIALLHSFGYTEAQRQFEAITKDDPTCAMAYWGVAMTQFQALWNIPTQSQMQIGEAEMEKARAAERSKPVTAREQAYIDALSVFFSMDPMNAFFDTPEKLHYQQRADAYTAKMEALHKAFPEDIEGAALDALAILASTPADDTSLTHEHRALAILLPLFALHPEHPGLAHYIIHTCDTPALAAEALPAAQEYAKIAPSSAHALHMPSHIFARLGMWKEDIASNEASVKASDKAEAEHEPGAAHQLHARQFLIYALLQVGEDERAHALAADMHNVATRMAAMPAMDDMKEYGNWFDNQVRVIYDMEMHDWKALAAEKNAPGTKPDEAYMVAWGHGIAAGHLKDAAMMTRALKDFDTSYDALKNSPYGVYSSALEIQRNELLAWQAQIAGNAGDAEMYMRKAADQQDKLGQGEVDIPAREMLGDLLMLQKKPAAALKEYRVALRLSPNRLNGLLSASEAAYESGDKKSGLAYYKQAEAQAPNNQRVEMAARK